MTDHVHELSIGAELNIIDEAIEIYAECGCGYILSQDQIDTMLNAAELFYRAWTRERNETESIGGVPNLTIMELNDIVARIAYAKARGGE